MDRAIEVKLNQLAQGLFSIEEGQSWFTSLSLMKQKEILQILAHFVREAGARQSDVPEAIKQSGMKATYTPSVLLSKGKPQTEAYRLLGLPAYEYPRAFPLLLSLFKIVDERRRVTQCARGCSHWWHQDLANPQIVASILSSGDAS